MSKHSPSRKKPAASAGQNSEQAYRTLVETSHDLIWSVDAKGRWTFVNAAARRIYGYEPGEMLGRPFTDFETPEQAARDLAVFAQILAGKPYFNYETEHRRKDGSPVWLSYNAVVVCDEQGRVVGTSGTAQDITERMQAEGALRENQRRLVAAERVAHLGNWSYEVSTGRIVWSEELYRIFGLEPGLRQITYETVRSTIHPEDRSRHDDYFARMLALTRDSPPLPSLEYRLLRPDGVERWVEVFLETEFNEQNTPAKFFGTVQDITESKMAENAIRDKERILAGLMGNLPGMVYRCQNDRDWTMVFVSPGSLALTGYPPGDLVKSKRISYADIIHPEDRDRVWKVVQEGVALSQPFTLEYRIITAQGVEKWVWERGSAILGPAGDLVALEGFVTDITARRQAEALLREGEARLRNVFDGMTVFVGVVSADGCILELNQTAVATSGLAREALIGKPLADAPWWSYSAELKKRIRGILQRAGQGEVVREELVAQVSGGGIITVDATFSPLRDAAGAVRQIIASGVDITERRSLGDVLEASLNEIYLFDAQTLRFEYVNDCARRNLGYAMDALRGLTPLDIKPEFTEAAFGELIGPLHRHEKEKIVFQTVHRRADDSRYPVEVHLQLAQRGGKAVFLAVINDITERRRSEEALRDNEARLQALFSQSPLAIVLTTLPEGRVADANAAAEVLLGRKLAEVRGRTTTELQLWADTEDRDRYLQLLRKDGFVNGFEARMRRFDGSEIVVLYHGRAVSIAGQSYVLNSLLDITARRLTEDALRLEGAALQAAANAVFITDRNGIIQWINPAFTLLSGYTADEAIGQKPSLVKSGVHDESFYRQIWESVLTGQVWRGHITNRSKAGQLYVSEQTIGPVKDARGEITHFVSVQEDITERMKLEEQLRQAQKMEAVGQLAGGVAHDFNNMLTAIIGHLGLLRGNPQVTPGIAESLSEITAAANRAAKLTSQLLAFSRRQVMSTSALDLNEVVTHLTKMLRRILGEEVSMQLDFAPEQLTFNGDAGLMEQVLMNLAVNARDAMPGGGQLRIATRSELRAPPAVKGQTGAAGPGAFVRLSVCDTGTGILPDHKARIFEPFFTTKDVGKGTGLGLATVFGIVQQHHGWIELDTEMGRGTTFHVYLPRLAASPLAVTPKSPAPAARGRNELVLLVEDEPAVQELGMRALSGYGYRVITASNGPAALVLWAKHKAEIQLLLTDIIMPGGISGIQLASQLLQETPALKVIYSSGYSAEIAGKEIKLTDGINYLSKPYELDLLFRTVRTALDSRKPSKQPF